MANLPAPNIHFAQIPPAPQPTFTPPPPPPPDPVKKVLLKDITIPNLPSPYYHFEYNSDSLVTKVDFASGFSIYDVLYSGNNIAEMRNNIIVNHDTLRYLYDNTGKVFMITFITLTTLVLFMIPTTTTSFFCRASVYRKTIPAKKPFQQGLALPPIRSTTPIHTRVTTPPYQKQVTYYLPTGLRQDKDSRHTLSILIIDSLHLVSERSQKCGLFFMFNKSIRIFPPQTPPNFRYFL